MSVVTREMVTIPNGWMDGQMHAVHERKGKTETDLICDTVFGLSCIQTKLI